MTWTRRTIIYNISLVNLDRRSWPGNIHERETVNSCVTRKSVCHRNNSLWLSDSFSHLTQDINTLIFITTMNYWGLKTKVLDKFWPTVPSRPSIVCSLSRKILSERYGAPFQCQYDVVVVQKRLFKSSSEINSKANPQQGGPVAIEVAKKQPYLRTKYTRSALP